MEKITIQVSVRADLQKTWDYYTQPIHITQWNHASEDWQCPTAINDLRVGGLYSARMEAKDGSVGFDFEAVYTNVVDNQRLAYVCSDGRVVEVTFVKEGFLTEVCIRFDPETENPIELQRNGWQAILNNFKKHIETQ